MNLSGPSDVAGTAGTEIADVTGSGKAVLFRDGRVLIKGDLGTRGDRGPRPIPDEGRRDHGVEAGTTWIHLVPEREG